jgi:hypothetical protein
MAIKSTKTILLSGALALACALPISTEAQTAKDYARYSTYATPRSQGQNVNGMHIFLFATVPARMIIPTSWTAGPSFSLSAALWWMARSPSPVRNNSTSPMS